VANEGQVAGSQANAGRQTGHRARRGPRNRLESRLAHRLQAIHNEVQSSRPIPRAIVLACASFLYAGLSIMIAYAARHLTRRLALVAILPGVALLPTAATAEEGGGAAALVLEVKVDTAVGGGDAELFGDAIESRVAAQLGAAGHELALDGQTYVGVEVRWEDEGQTTYAVTVMVRRHGETLVRKTAKCRNCGTAELFHRIALSIDDIADELGSASREMTSEATDGEMQPTNDAPEERSGPGRPRLTWRGWTGVALASTGLAVGGVGIGLWSKGKEIDPDSINQAILVGTDYRPPGIALTAVGGVAVVSGIVLLVVDATRNRDRRVSVATTITPKRGAMVGLRGRF